MIDGLKDKVVIVTGGAHGIGKAYCKGLAGAGARIVIADIDSPGAEAAAGEIGAQALPILVDVSNEDSTKKMGRASSRPLRPASMFSSTTPRYFPSCR
jgi:NAD(P)-dependent dehydrogenase (short-subunit alcohol dehydrogenase family)